MECSEFRQMIMGDPSTADGEAHIESCVECQAYLREVQSLDATLQKAMALPVPELTMPELPDIDDSNVTSITPRRRKAPVWLAMAATVALAAFVGIRAFVPHDHGGFDSLADEIIAHMDHEPYSRVVTDVAVSDRRLARVVPASVANLSHDAGLITYAQTCEINGKQTPHLVIQGERGPVTILLLPDETIESAQPLMGESFTGVLLPVGSGSIAIIAEDEGEDLERIQKSLMDSVSWRT